MTKTDQLNMLFEKWEKDNRCGDDFNVGEFIRDGIIDESEYSNQKIKVLFISNEANGGKKHIYDKNRDEPLDRRELFMNYHKTNEESWSGRLKERVSCLYQVVINDYSKNPYEVANCFAFMNLNKYAGEQKTDISHIEEFCKAYICYIKKEIEIIYPDIIIWLAYNTFEEGTKIIGAKKNILTIGSKSVPIIRTWHTSYHCIPKNKPKLHKFDTNDNIKYNDLVDKHAYNLYVELKNIDFYK